MFYQFSFACMFYYTAISERSVVEVPIEMKVFFYVGVSSKVRSYGRHHACGWRSISRPIVEEVLYRDVQFLKTHYTYLCLRSTGEAMLEEG